MFFVHCMFCHKLVFRPFYERHKRKHTTRLADGQMTDHITVDPTERYTGSLAGVPMWYYHSTCGVVTGMPEEIVRSYLVNPFLYDGETSFRHGCNDYVSQAELFWQETDQSLADYDRGLKEQYLKIHGKPPPAPFVD